MSLSQSERDLAAEIDFDEFVLAAIAQECQAEMHKLILEQKVYLKDDELSFLNEVLPACYLDFNQDIYGAYNYGGKLLVEGLSVSIPARADHRHIFLKLKHLLAARGYITICENLIGFISKQHRIKSFIQRVLKFLFSADLKIAIFKAEDILDIIKIYQTNGWNYDISPRDIINKLKNWQEISKFEVIFACHTGFSIEFTELPEDIESFARDVHKFCPDVQNPQSVVREIEKHKSLYLSWD